MQEIVDARSNCTKQVAEREREATAAGVGDWHAIMVPAQPLAAE